MKRTKRSGRKEELLDKTIYTVIIGSGYKLRDPEKVCPDWNYICYTDQDIKSDVWKIIRYDKTGCSSDNRVVSRIPKICGVNGDISIYMDAKFKPINNLNGFVEKYLADKDIAVMNHNRRDCVYCEAEYLIKTGIENKENLTEQITRYLKEGMPKHFGLFSPGILIRRGSGYVQSFNEFWRDEYFKGSSRAMISLAYTIWHYPFLEIGIMPFRKTYKRWIKA